MNTRPKPICPCCAHRDPCRIGKLPDSRFFAGTAVPHILPGGHLYRCRHCRLKFRYPVEDPEILDLMYDNASIATWPTDPNRPDWCLIVRHIVEKLPRGGRVLDFGCYTGGLLGQLDSIVYERHGVEINRAAAEVASRVTGGRIWSTVDEIPPELRFDVVVAADVVEHISNPMETIDRLVALLTEKGSLIITTGDADNTLWNHFGANWWYCFYPEHIAFLSRDWFEYVSQVRSLTVVRSDKFRYCIRNPLRRAIEMVFTCLYGWVPASYLRVAGLIGKLAGRPAVTNVPGNGVTADHLLMVLMRKVNS